MDSSERNTRIRYTRWVGTVVAVLGALSTAISATTFDVQGIGWGATIMLGGLLVRQNAKVLQVNERLLRLNDDLQQHTHELHERNKRLREQQIQERYDYDRRK